MKKPLLSVLLMLFVTLACSSQATPPTASEAQSPIPEVIEPLPSTIEVTATPTEPSPLNDPCSNPLYPLITGNQWIYQISSAEADEPSRIGLTIEKVDENQATINSLDMTTGIITQTIAECDGTAIKNFPMMTLSMILGGYLDGDINTGYISGIFSPSTQELSTSNWVMAWEGDYITQGNLEVQYEEEQMTVIIKDSPLHLNWNSGENGAPVYETVSVAAGTFENALKVRREMEIDVALETTLGNFHGTLRIHSNHWFLPYTGLLKAEIDSSDLIYMGMTFPITLIGSIELVEFRQ